MFIVPKFFEGTSFSDAPCLISFKLTLCSVGLSHLRRVTPNKGQKIKIRQGPLGVKKKRPAVSAVLGGCGY
jgi:hypothetical protein